MKYLDLGDMPDTSHLEIIKKLVDEITIQEKHKLIKYIKGTMKPPATPIMIDNLVKFK
jgi:hypothetical protein